MTHCLFCQIAHHTASEQQFLYRDREVMAIYDIKPAAPVHILIIPMKHIATLNDLLPADKPLVGHMIYVAKTIAAQKNIADSGYKLVCNCNQHGVQVIYHLHLHLLGGGMLSGPQLMPAPLQPQ